MTSRSAMGATLETVPTYVNSADGLPSVPRKRKRSARFGHRTKSRPAPRGTASETPALDRALSFRDLVQRVPGQLEGGQMTAVHAARVDADLIRQIDQHVADGRVPEDHRAPEVVRRFD